MVPCPLFFPAAKSSLSLALCSTVPALYCRSVTVITASTFARAAAAASRYVTAPVAEIHQPSALPCADQFPDGRDGQSSGAQAAGVLLTSDVSARSLIPLGRYQRHFRAALTKGSRP